MKKFLTITASLLIGAVIATVIVYWVIMSEVSQPAVVTNDETEETQILEREEIPLRSLPLNDAHKSILNKIGIDAETFIITPEMQDCAVNRLGRERLTEIFGGADPKALEIATLTACLSVE